MLKRCKKVFGLKAGFVLRVEEKGGEGKLSGRTGKACVSVRMSAFT